MNKNIISLIWASIFSLCLISPIVQSASIANLAGIDSITIWENTQVLMSDPLNEINLSFTDARLNNRLTTLDSLNNDFTTSVDEFYDFFYSDSDGTANSLGAFLTIETRYNPPSIGSLGGNVSRVDLNFLGGAVESANSVSAFITAGPGLAGSVGNAVDGDLNTTTLLGNTDSISTRLMVTVGFASTSPVPIPATVWLFGSGLLGLIGMARRKKA